MKEELKYIRNKVDVVDEKLDLVDKHLAVYNEQLKVHIKRSELLEEQFEPVKKHVDFVNFTAKLISIISFVAALIITIKTLLEL